MVLLLGAAEKPTAALLLRLVLGHLFFLLRLFPCLPPNNRRGRAIAPSGSSSLKKFARSLVLEFGLTSLALPRACILGVLLPEVGAVPVIVCRRLDGMAGGTLSLAAGRFELLALGVVWPDRGPAVFAMERDLSGNVPPDFGLLGLLGSERVTPRLVSVFGVAVPGVKVPEVAVPATALLALELLGLTTGLGALS